jgi:hypothetical protein
MEDINKQLESLKQRIEDLNREKEALEKTSEDLKKSWSGSPAPSDAGQGKDGIRRDLLKKHGFVIIDPNRRTTPDVVSAIEEEFNAPLTRISHPQRA